MIHTGSVRQTAAIVAMEQDHLRSGDKSRLHLRFVRSPEYLHVGARLIFREGRTKAVGTVTQLYDDANPPAKMPVTLSSKEAEEAAAEGTS